MQGGESGISASGAQARQEAKHAGMATTTEPANFQGTSTRNEQSQAGSGGQGAGDEAVSTDVRSIHSEIDRKRLEFEQQRAAQRLAFEQQMQLLERKQREEEASLMSGSKGPLDSVAGNQAVPHASAPSTPPGNASRQTSASSTLRSKTTNSSPRPTSMLGAASSADDPLSFRAQLGDMSDTQPEEGLNGSNVPGLPPPSTARSVPSSRRISAGPEAVSSTDRRALGSASGDLAHAFERLSVGSHRNVSQVRAQLAQEAGTLNSAPNAPANHQHAPGSNRPVAPHVLQRALTRSGSGSGAENGESGFTPVFNERFLFDDEALEADDSAFVRKYNLKEEDDDFPVLIRRDSYPGMLSASSAALDLAPLAQAPRSHRGAGGAIGEAQLSEWPQYAGHSEAVHQHHAPPHSAGLVNDRRGRSERNSPQFGPIAGPRLPSGAASLGTTGQRAASVSQVAGNAQPHHLSQQLGAAAVRGDDERSQGSHSTNSPSRNGSSQLSVRPPTQAPSDVTEQSSNMSNSFRSGDVALKPTNDLAAGPQSRSRLSAGPDADSISSFPSFALAESMKPQANPNPLIGGARATTPNRFGPYGSGGPSATGFETRPRPSSGFFEAFSPPSALGSTQSDIFNRPPVTNQQQHGGHFGIGLDGDPLLGLAGAQSAQQRKNELDVNTPLEQLHGEIFALCKDQHGCRYLQKKLEEGLPTYRDMIFAETFKHFTELMTDPFGNYLCQKMLEYCTDDQRNLIVESVSSELVTISLNMHGTRAVQKMIDFLSTPRQIRSIIGALTMNVVTLIKDLNGNHVIQKCLNRLGAEDDQFIYNAVAAHCVEVATHRHGCCVLQRCIDHASETQRMQLVTEITFNALTLVQDPFGNYVVQYILDLNDPRYSDAVVQQFIGNVCLLSVQKFSSNVMEKCIRVSNASLRKQLIDELLNRARLEKLLRDSFGNYVVQTSLDYAEPLQRVALVDCIRPILPVIRNTPYGKRIQSKLQRDNLDFGPPMGGMAHPHMGPGMGGGMNGRGGMPGMPYALLQAAQQQQHLHAIAAMGNQRQGQANGYGMDGMSPMMGYANGGQSHGMNYQQNGMGMGAGVSPGQMSGGEMSLQQGVSYGASQHMYRGNNNVPQYPGAPQGLGRQMPPPSHVAQNNVASGGGPPPRQGPFAGAQTQAYRGGYGGRQQAPPPPQVHGAHTHPFAPNNFASGNKTGYGGASPAMGMPSGTVAYLGNGYPY
ncbi:Translational repressor MPT5/PUF4 and related RNA-binding proteins (Puf superfamily) [Ceraceosorus bombacis]|uniref:Translational repressor MPT5/PUF4 and related RNA-binding proteins (Puf superfamily) n=1 Tax=Ceraceosorus bombacis TaxID=401625 RepID=A0A0P1BD18_9BASI|nr:Translational repressor MPT5/PUF4 and related RNA-binding proteins (Puf superfamily) [Ceraceosorus bombacis]